MMSKKIQKSNYDTIFALVLKFDGQFCLKKYYMTIFASFITITWLFLHFNPKMSFVTTKCFNFLILLTLLYINQHFLTITLKCFTFPILLTNILPDSPSEGYIHFLQSFCSFYIRVCKSHLTLNDS